MPSTGTSGSARLGRPQCRFQRYIPGDTQYRGIRSSGSIGEKVGNSFGTDILIQSEDPKKAAQFYVEQLGFTVTDDNPKMMGLRGDKINLYIEPGAPLGPVLEVTVKDVAEARDRLVRGGCTIIKDEPDVPRIYVRDPQGLIYNLTD